MLCGRYKIDIKFYIGTHGKHIRHFLKDGSNSEGDLDGNQFFDTTL